MERRPGPSRRQIGIACVLGLVAPLGFATASEPAAAEAGVALACGTRVTEPNTTIVLAGDVGPCTDAVAIEINASNVTVDLNGHAVRGDGFQLAPHCSCDLTGAIGLRIATAAGNAADGVVVKNGTVTGFATGISLERVNRASLTRLRIIDNIGPNLGRGHGAGIRARFGGGDDANAWGGHLIKSNEVVHNGPLGGILLEGPTSNNVVTGNVVTDNNILLPGIDPGDLSIMDDSGIRIVHGFNRLGAGTTGNVVAGNQVARNGYDGIHVAAFADGNVIRGNWVTGNGFGSLPTDFRDGDGIHMLGQGTLVESNTVTNNGGDGIDVGSHGNTIRMNRAAGNGGGPLNAAIGAPHFDLFGRSSDPCNGNTWSGNRYATKSPACLQ